MVEIPINIPELWGESPFNPSSRCQSGGSPIDKKVIAKIIEKEIFSKFPQLVIGNLKIHIMDNLEFDMTEIYIYWSVWMPVGIIGKMVTLEKVPEGIKIQLPREILEDQPEALSLYFKQSLITMKEQMEKIGFEFYKKGIDPASVVPYLRKNAQKNRVMVSI